MKCKKCNIEHDGSFGKGVFCSRSCANSRVWDDDKKERHSLIMKTSPKVIESANIKNEKKWTVKKCLFCNDEFDVRAIEYDRKTYCSMPCASMHLKISGKLGGRRDGSGHGKQGWYKSVQCDSSYELAWVIYNIDKGIDFERNKTAFKYKYKGVTHNYYPDFYLIKDDLYVEIKGYSTKQNEAKIKSFKKRLIVLYKKDLKYIFDYVIKKYGKNFIELYEGNPHNKRNNKCLICGEPAIRLYCSWKCSGIHANKIRKERKNKNDKTRRMIKKANEELGLFAFSTKKIVEIKQAGDA